jgi:prepilin-type N-terminal cleavage/methylation domain-containing protein
MKNKSSQFNFIEDGFTLVELAIVIVVIGLLVSGVLQGQELIKQAQIRKTISQFNDYDRAIATFKSKYGSNLIPGDFNDAHRFGIDKNSNGDLNVAKTSSLNNDGNGDGILRDSDEAPFYFDGEIANFWVHLSNTGLVKGSYQQVNDCEFGACNNKAGIAFPDTSVAAGIVILSHYSKLNYLLGGGATLYAVQEGRQVENSLLEMTLTPQDAYSIDSKIDDGDPAKGIVLSVMIYNGATNIDPYFTDESEPGFEDQRLCNNDSNQYNLSQNDKRCLIRILSVVN